MTFRYKDYGDDHKQKTMTLDALEFLRRFGTHVLPSGFVKVRHYGLLANRFRDERLSTSRRLLEAVGEAAPSDPVDRASVAAADSAVL